MQVTTGCNVARRWQAWQQFTSLSWTNLDCGGTRLTAALTGARSCLSTWLSLTTACMSACHACAHLLRPEWWYTESPQNKRAQQGVIQHHRNIACRSMHATTSKPPQTPQATSPKRLPWLQRHALMWVRVPQSTNAAHRLLTQALCCMTSMLWHTAECSPAHHAPHHMLPPAVLVQRIHCHYGKAAGDV